MTYFSFVWNFFQTPGLSRDLRKVVELSYAPLVSFYIEHPDYPCAISLPASLARYLRKSAPDLFYDLVELVDRGQVELATTSKDLVPLPIVPWWEVLSQVIEGSRGILGCLGYRPSGFVPPDYAYSHAVAWACAEAGFSWLLLDEWTFKLTNPRWDWRWTFRAHWLEVAGRRLPVLCRSFGVSRGVWLASVGAYDVDKILDLASELGPENILISCTEAQLFGIYWKKGLGWLEKAYDSLSRKCEIVLPSQYLREVPPEGTVFLNASTALPDRSFRMLVKAWESPCLDSLLETPRWLCWLIPNLADLAEALGMDVRETKKMLKEAKDALFRAESDAPRRWDFDVHKLISAYANAIRAGELCRRSMEVMGRA